MIKRLFDMLAAGFGLVLLSPLLFAIALLILLDSKGGIFFYQYRVGRYNKDFRLLKFRTMYRDSDKKGLITVGKRDPRITRAGYYLRKNKLDELPQLLNVLKGDMSLVGPRPEVRKYVNMYNDEQMKVLSVRPGLTDYSSIYYIDENEQLERSVDPEKEYVHVIMPHKLELARKYCNEKGFVTDMKIIFKTLAKIILKK
jgi:lipopolysaccharide/colanic/teichoic acid biosynthesis glycosyltransferase